MGRSLRFVIYGIVFVLLVGSNVWAFSFASGASAQKEAAYTERYTLSVAVYELSTAQSALVRWMRVVAVTGNQLQYDLYWEEYALDRMGQALWVFELSDAHPDEITIIRDILERREDMSRLIVEAFGLRRDGYYQEAIDLAFGFDMRQWGTPFNQDVEGLIEMSALRTQQVVDAATARLETSQTFTFLSIILLAMVALLAIYETHKLRLFRYIYAYGVVVLVLIGHILLLSVRAVQVSSDIGEAFDLQYAQSSAMYEAEQATEELSRLARHFTVTGGSIPYELYHQELDRDRIVQAFRTLITSRAPDAEVNHFVSFISKTSALRQIEGQAIHLRMEGYDDEALGLVFSDIYAQHGIPLNTIVRDLRSMSFLRTQDYIDTASAHYDRLRAFQAALTALFVLTSFGGLAALKLRLKKLHVNEGDKGGEGGGDT